MPENKKPKDNNKPRAGFNPPLDSDKSQGMGDQRMGAALGGGGTSSVGGVSAAGGMSPTERVQYIQELQKVSPLTRIVEAVKKLKLSDLGLSKTFFEAGADAMKSAKTAYENIRNKKGINQPLSGLTENVRGVEQFKHEMDPGANVDLVDGEALDKKKGLYVDMDWAPKKKGQVE